MHNGIKELPPGTHCGALCKPQKTVMRFQQGAKMCSEGEIKPKPSEESKKDVVEQ